MNAYRTPAEIAQDIPPARKIQTRRLLAQAVVAPVRFVQWILPWLIANVVVAVTLTALWVNFPHVMWKVQFGINALVGLTYAGYRAHAWAVDVLENDE